MSKKIILSGLLGGLTLIIWMVVISGIFGFKRKVSIMTATLLSSKMEK